MSRDERLAALRGSKGGTQLYETTLPLTRSRLLAGRLSGASLASQRTLSELAEVGSEHEREQGHPHEHAW